MYIVGMTLSQWTYPVLDIEEGDKISGGLGPEPCAWLNRVRQ